MKPVVQEEKTGCGIASVAAILGKTYSEMKEIANVMGIYASDESLWSDTRYVRRMLSASGIETSPDEIYMCHGSPTNDFEYLLENVETGFPCLRSDSQIMTSLQGQLANIILCGHTHIPRTVRTHSGQLIINPGSVGLPAYTDNEPVIHSMENYCPQASYAILEKNTTEWTIQQIKVPYDYQKAAKLAKEHQREDWGHFLNTGRGLSQDKLI